MKNKRLTPFMWLFLVSAMLGLVLGIILVTTDGPALAQNTNPAHVEFAWIKPEGSGTLPFGDNEPHNIVPLPVNYGGALLEEVGLGRDTSLWPTDPWTFDFTVLDTSATGDSAWVRLKARRNPRASKVEVDYRDTLVVGEIKRFPKIGEEVSGLPWDMILVKAGDFSGLAKKDRSIVYLRDYAAYAARAEKRLMRFYGALAATESDTVADTSAAIGWTRRTGLSLAMIPGKDSCIVSIKAQVWAEDTLWIETLITLSDSVALDSSAWTTITPPSVMTGDSLRIITIPHAVCKHGYMPLRGTLTAI